MVLCFFNVIRLNYALILDHHVDRAKEKER